MDSADNHPMESAQVDELSNKSFSHVLVPVHRILSSEEKISVLERYNATLKQLPRISIKDSAIKGLGAVKVGDVIEIERNSQTAGKSLYYRVVVNE